MINSNPYLRGQLAARAKDRCYENIEQGIYEMAREEIIKQIKPYVEMKVAIMSFTPKVMVFTQDGRQLLNEYPPEVRVALDQCNRSIAEVYQRFNDALNTSRYYGVN